MKRLALVAFTFAGLAACDAPSRPSDLTIPGPSFEVIINATTPFSDTVFNPCPPTEDVAISGEVHLVVASVGDALRFHVSWENVKGVGLSTGATYTAKNNEKEEFVFLPPTLTLESQSHFRLVREGSLDDFDLFIVSTFTLPPGTWVIDKVRMECRG